MNASAWILPMAWGMIAIFFAWKRSFWGDELVRYHQVKLPLAAALRDLYAEPSPFAPGEILLNWLCDRGFGWFLPDEVWARLPGIAWGLGTLSIASRMGSNNGALRILPYLTFFSTPLLFLSVEMRPYGALIFGGALALKILWDENPWEDPFNRIVSIPALLLGHLYGICFVAFSCLLRKSWGRALLGFSAVASVFLVFGKPAGHWNTAAYPPAFEIFKQTAGALGNPHKGAWILLPLAAFGVQMLARDSHRRAVQMGLLLLAAIGGPLAATFFSKYYFVPRQITGGILPFLTLAALGLEGLRGFLKVKRGLIGSGLAVLVIAWGGIIPWIRSTVLHQPPFTNQPPHKFKEVTQTLLREKVSSALVLDPCSASAMEHYLSKALDSRPFAATHPAPYQGKIEEKCWASGFCLRTLSDFDACSFSEGHFDANTEWGRLARQAAFESKIFIYGLPSAPFETKRSMRTW